MPESTSHHVTLRPASREDSRRIWEWRNDPEARRASFHTDYIPYKEHEPWFSRKLLDPHARFYVVLNEQMNEVGYVRFEIVGAAAEVSLCIAKNERGKGYGAAAVKTASEQMIATKVIRRVVAYVKSNNRGSISVFTRAGYISRGYKQIAGLEALEMEFGAKQISFDWTE